MYKEYKLLNLMHSLLYNISLNYDSITWNKLFHRKY